MSPSLIPLTDFRLPGYPSASVNLNGQPLCIFAEEDSPLSTIQLNNKNKSHSTLPTGIATILYRWHPNALAAFLDLDAWFSLTWSVTLASSNGTRKLEIGRIGNQITFGTLDASGDNWEVMLTYNIVLSGEERGTWVANLKESMVGEKDVESVDEAERLGEEWVRKAVSDRVWDAGKGVKHGFWVEYAPMDIFGDGIPMSPHWLYASLDLGICATCGKEEGDTGRLNRCGRCGTAAYCSGVCQKNDWKVHKWVCTMSVEDRGQALKISENGGLVGWDTSKTMVAQGETVLSENPNFAEPQLKRQRR
jgi:hypothetical protein